jgi:acetyl-CoA synthetase
MLSPLPISLLKPGSVTKPLPGVEADVVDKDGTPMPPGKGGLLVVTKPWPAMMTGLWNDDDRYKEYWTQIPGAYYAGDVARKDEDGYIWIQGRADDVINIAGHRIGSAEVEAAFSTNPAVNEVAVIGVPDKIKGEAAKAFVILNNDFTPDDAMVKELKRTVRNELGPVAVIKSVEFRETLPRTRSGKIMRRVLKSEEMGNEIGDLTGMQAD